MASSSAYVARVLEEDGKGRVRSIHQYIAKRGTVDIKDLVRWYRRVSASKATYPSVVYATLSALERKGDIKRERPGHRGFGSITHLDPCRVNSRS